MMETVRIPASRFEFKAAGSLVRVDWLFDVTVRGIATELGLTEPPRAVQVTDSHGHDHEYRLISSAPGMLDSREHVWLYQARDTGAPSRSMRLRSRIR